MISICKRHIHWSLAEKLLLKNTAGERVLQGLVQEEVYCKGDGGIPGEHK